MVKLDVTLLRYLSKEDFRILTAVETGMRNHELVPASLVASISSLKHGGVGKALNELTRHKLLCYERGKRFDGYRLNYLGYDYLALNVLRSRNVVSQVGNQIGVGKESDVFVAADDDGKRYALKIHRLGRTCFRTVNEKRDYHRSGKKVHNWIYLSRLAALREFAFMKALHAKGFPVPTPIECNRHCVVMELIQGTLLNNVSADMLHDAGKLYDSLMNLLLKLANEYGVVHGDFNEFNIMVLDESQDPVLIDFPQMVPVNHKFAEAYFERDVNCVVEFFKKRFEYVADTIPTWKEDVVIDENVEAITQLVDQDVDIAADQDEFCEEEQFEDALDQLSISQAANQAPERIESSAVDDKNSDAAAINSDNDTDDGKTEYSMFSTTSKCTFAPQEVRGKVRREKQKDTKRKEIKAASKNIKGDSNAVRRQRNEDRLTIREDLNTHKVQPF